MQISSTSTAYSGGEAQRLLARLLEPQGPPAGQDLPSDSPPTGASDATGAPPQPSGGPSAAQFATETLASLLNVQQAPPASSDIAQQVISAADADGDGSLSLDEVEKALGQDTASGADGLSQAFAQLDTNGDGKLSQDELASAIDAHKASGAHHHHHRAHNAQASDGDLASAILGKADTNGDGALSADEIASALGANASDSLTQAIASLDKDGDGKLDSSELAAGIQAFRTALQQGQAGTASTSQAVTAA
jgi:Ca2+-binding EF-hand superfamily protein